MWSVAIENFRVVDRLLASPSPELKQRLALLAPGESRLLMRHQGSEVNRLFFDRWGWMQLGLGVVLVGLVFYSTPDRWLRITIVLMTLIAAGLQLAVVPEAVRLGRLLDFTPRSPAPPELAPFWRFHNAYTTLDSVKLLLGIFGVARSLRKVD